MRMSSVVSALLGVDDRCSHLDKIVVASGNRYAANQFAALIPETLGPCHLSAGGALLRAQCPGMCE